MATGFCVVGYGRVGRVTASALREMGHGVLVFDASARNVEEARRAGFEAELADVESKTGAMEVASRCSVIATALPSRVAERAIPVLLDAGAGVVVDVSYVRDPMAFRVLAEEAGASLYVDMGVAPGLSNILVAHSAGNMDRVERAIIHVGGVSEKPDPLGIVASWNMWDLVEEYTRPARARVNGAPATLDPIADATRVEVPGAGVFDAMPTDGLRTLLHTLDAATLVEYTLRYPGHVELLRSLRRLGLLDARSLVVEGCSLQPRAVLAKLLEEKLPRGGDRLVLYTLVEGVKGSAGKRTEYIVDVSQGELGSETPVLTLVTGLVHAWAATVAAQEGRGRGLVAPEALAPRLPELLRHLAGHGVHPVRRTTYEEPL